MIPIIASAGDRTDNEIMRQNATPTGWGCIVVTAVLFAGIVAGAAWPLREKDPSLFLKLVLGTAVVVGAVSWNADRRKGQQRSTWQELASELGWVEDKGYQEAIAGNYAGYPIRLSTTSTSRRYYTSFKLDLPRPVRGELTIDGKDITLGQGFVEVSLGDPDFEANYGFKGTLDAEAIQRVVSDELRANLERTRSGADKLLTGQGVPLIEVSDRQIVYRVLGRLTDMESVRNHLNALTCLAKQCELHLCEPART